MKCDQLDSEDFSEVAQATDGKQEPHIWDCPRISGKLPLVPLVTRVRVFATV